ncbi:MAG: TlpA disulfide reductase family protein [Proteiniphilum sp.]|uniref:TlpA disulfide reductase family protein n=1 Tax=Proteiniphilum sp. TaxID=1926877 RepID=UPI002B202897|nr:TlpA disulfide reductase family protein [Proteiniphilum sp.]MEA5128093.1 TlpA disulfide reductase family protein [Proteiniphilum sp.]
MKTKQILIVFFLAIFAIACNNQSGENYTVSGEIKGIAEGSHIQLIPVSHEMEEPLADTLVVNGKFTFKGSVEEPRAVMLKVKDGYGMKYIMLDNSTHIKVNGEITSSESNGNIFYDFSNVVVTGSPLTEYYTEQLNVRERMDSLHSAYMTKYEGVMKDLNAARNEKNQQAIDSITATDEYKGLEQAEREFFTTVETSYNDIFMENKDTYWGPLLMITLMTYFADDQKTLYEEFSPEAKGSFYGQKVHAELYPAGNLGSKVEEFSVKDQNGTETTFAELRQAKKYILLDFWASWCNPCLKEIPHLKKLYSQYQDKGFEIVSISIDQKEDDWKNKLEEVNLPWPNYLDRNGIATLYKVRAVPTMYLVDEQGVLVAENLRGEELDNKLAELFVEK